VQKGLEQHCLQDNSTHLLLLLVQHPCWCCLRDQGGNLIATRSISNLSDGMNCCSSC
jgi:hypothetical protein